MYVQSPVPDAHLQGGFTLPKGYSGSAFSPQGQESPPTAPTSAPPATDPTPDHTQSLAPNENEQHQDIAEDTARQEPAPATEAFAPSRDKRGEGSLFTRLPFLSSLLPPPRHKGAKGGLPEWAVIGLVLFLLLNNSENDNDLLPFVLLLLLWD
ncbi:MAG: hypothetical protein E7639_01155 [Ruminococcaceae bacterium]|nr:hypothetical protein [Oscillospiraceae bacterium]